MFFISRLILGFATAFAVQAAPILISELSYPTVEHLGAVIAAWTTYGTFRLNSTWSWRIPSVLQAATPQLQLCLVRLVPESPRWLVSKCRVAEARKTLVKYYGDGDELSALVTFEIKEVEESIWIERHTNSEALYVDLVRTPANRKRTFIALVSAGLKRGVALQ
ncbi:hypothetical protein PV08_05163 [Exophiala spinifera]|uniref:Major facilitator superfamily (MFS) profile domain-containing protein n=1 Tax=Exophiala spinifera TaxID=91928 RepID=A0A0D2BG72_9EURO|nr:uncharacterized protein PV08_05163 [Exophiala spinifera]KIW17968.1 hypothetical protein PV08_05163 [Exophiala spinifera]